MTYAAKQLQWQLYRASIQVSLAIIDELLNMTFETKQ